MFRGARGHCGAGDTAVPVIHQLSHPLSLLDTAQTEAASLELKPGCPAAGGAPRVQHLEDHSVCEGAPAPALHSGRDPRCALGKGITRGCCGEAEEPDH